MHLSLTIYGSETCVFTESFLYKLESHGKEGFSVSLNEYLDDIKQLKKKEKKKIDCWRRFGDCQDVGTPRHQK